MDAYFGAANGEKKKVSQKDGGKESGNGMERNRASFRYPLPIHNIKDNV